MQLAGQEMHEVALAVLKKSEDERLEEEIAALMKWLRELSNRDARQGKVTVLGEIQDEVLHEIVKSSKVEAYKPNQILIKQGNVGFAMYIILTGMCDIRISSADTTEEDDTEATEDPFEEGDVLVKKKPAEIEALLGVSVGTFKAGHAFGEVALVSGVLRTASVIVNPDSDICQVLVIDKSLFDRTLQDYMRREEAGKANFIEQFSHFSTWPVKFRQQLLRGLSKTRFKYSEQVMRQGDEIDCVYFITSGEVKQSLVPGLHREQYSRFLGPQLIEQIFGIERHPLNERLKGAGRCRDWCCVSKNEVIGGLEVVLGMKTYLCHGVATMETNMYRLNLREWTRLVERRHPNTLNSIKEDLLCRLSLRTLLLHTSEAPLLGYAIGLLYEQVRKMDRKAQSQQQQPQLTQQQQLLQQAKPRRGHLQLPRLGPLIDQWGPGTVFDYINRRFRRQQLREARAAAAALDPAAAASGLGGVGASSQLPPPPPSSSKLKSLLMATSANQPTEEEELDPDELQYRDRCRLLRILSEGQHDPRPRVGRPFLAREELQLVGMERLESQVTNFCQRLRKPGERSVTVPQLTRPELLEPPKEPACGLLRPVPHRRTRRRHSHHQARAGAPQGSNANFSSFGDKGASRAFLPAIGVEASGESAVRYSADLGHR
ncbi:hypothetical protein BOX15_Mlig030379g1 [Macrostomum lignano]|uniref:Cyclic nucleotide-binding domain-containing protein n=1 Tax=Macrostomum lignano TaxID=282301 RepID=A0A267E995_9PLAT|nr:hypothetical protein BOX15_Mlig030379g1 [Macrostomum lignano]